MKKLLLLILLSSQVSAELMSLKCEYEQKRGNNLVTDWNIFTFDKNQGSTADIKMYIYTGRLENDLVGAKINWTPSAITISYTTDYIGETFYYKDVISREDLSYQTEVTYVTPYTYYGQCKIVDVAVKKVF